MNTLVIQSAPLSVSATAPMQEYRSTRTRVAINGLNRRSIFRHGPLFEPAPETTRVLPEKWEPVFREEAR
jgi:hypothetical protein